MRSYTDDNVQLLGEFQSYDSMKTETSMNLMLVAFCIVLVAFVFFNCRMNEALCKKQAEMEQRIDIK